METASRRKYPIGIYLPLPFCLYLEDKKYPVRLDGLDYNILLKEAEREINRLSNLPYASLKNAEILQSKFVPPQRYSEVAVFFVMAEYQNDNYVIYPEEKAIREFWGRISEHDSDIELASIDNQKVIEVALQPLNRLISIYRDVTKYFFTPYVRAQDFPAIRVVSTAIDDGFNQELVFQNVYPLHNICGQVPLVSQEEVSEIFIRLKDDDKTSIVDELILSANDFLNKGEFRLAIVEMETAFESAIQGLVRKHYASKREPLEELEKRLSKGIRRLLSEEYPKCLSEKIFNENIAEFGKWEKAYKTRNEILHQGMNVTREETLEAFLNFDAAFRYIFDNKAAFINLRMPPLQLG